MPELIPAACAADVADIIERVLARCANPAEVLALVVHRATLHYTTPDVRISFNSAGEALDESTLVVL